MCRPHLDRTASNARHIEATHPTESSRARAHYFTFLPSLSPLDALSFFFCAFFSFLTSSSSSGAGSHSSGLQFHQGQSGKHSTAEMPPPAESHRNVNRNSWLM